MKNSTYVKYMNGTATELDKRMLIGDIGYEIVIATEGYILEDRSGKGQSDGGVFDTIDDIAVHFEDRFERDFGESFTQNQKEALKFKSKITLITVAVIQDKDIFRTVKAIAQESGSESISSSVEGGVEEFQVSIALLSDLEEMMKDEEFISEIGLDSMSVLRQELLVAKRKDLSYVGVRIS